MYFVQFQTLKIREMGLKLKNIVILLWRYNQVLSESDLELFWKPFFCVCLYVLGSIGQPSL